MEVKERLDAVWSTMLPAITSVITKKLGVFEQKLVTLMKQNKQDQTTNPIFEANAKTMMENLPDKLARVIEVVFDNELDSLAIYSGQEPTRGPQNESDSYLEILSSPSTPFENSWISSEERALQRKFEALKLEGNHQNQPNQQGTKNQLGTANKQKKLKADFSKALNLHSNFLDEDWRDQEDQKDTKINETPDLALSDIPFTNVDQDTSNLLTKMRGFLGDLYSEVNELKKKYPGKRAFLLTESQRDDTWHKARSSRLTSSNFGKVFFRKNFINLEKFVKSTFFNKTDLMHVPAIKYGIETEPEALARYKQTISKGEIARETGFWVSLDYPYLGGSPDGLTFNQTTGETRSVEIKCPYTGRGMDIDEMFTTRIQKMGKRFFLQETIYHKLVLNHEHNYMAQVQGVMEIVGTQLCDFVVYTGSDVLVLKVGKDEEMVREMFAKLKMCYFRYVLPNLCRREGWDGEMPEYREISQALFERFFN